MNNKVNFNGWIFFIKIILTIFISSVVAFLIIDQFSPVMSLLIIPFLCIIFYLPLIIIFIVVTLLLYKFRTPFITKKSFNLFFVILGILLVLIQIGIIWPNVSPTYESHLYPDGISFSNDNSRLFAYCQGDGQLIVSLEPYEYICELYVWDINTGEVIWNKTTSEYINMKLSPDGNYLINNYNNSIFSISLNKYVEQDFGDHITWAQDGKSYITYNDTNIFIWETINFSLINSVTYNNAEKIIPSFDGSKIVIIPDGEGTKTLSVINIANNNSIYIFNTSVTDRSESIIWSEDGNEIQIVSRIPGWHSDSGQHYISYDVFVWNITNNILIQNTSFNHYFGEHGNNGILDIWFGEYVVRDFDQHHIIVYNFDGEKIQTYEYYQSPVYSYDKKLVAYCSDGNIKILNTATGKIIRTFSLPTYEFERMIPGFEVIILMAAIGFILFFKQRKKFKK